MLYYSSSLVFLSVNELCFKLEGGDSKESSLFMSPFLSHLYLEWMKEYQLRTTSYFITYLSSV